MHTFMWTPHTFISLDCRCIYHLDYFFISEIILYAFSSFGISQGKCSFHFLFCSVVNCSRTLGHKQPLICSWMHRINVQKVFEENVSLFLKRSRGWKHLKFLCSSVWRLGTSVLSMWTSPCGLPVQRERERFIKLFLSKKNEDLIYLHVTAGSKSINCQQWQHRWSGLHKTQVFFTEAYNNYPKKEKKMTTDLFVSSYISHICTFDSFLK